MLLIATTPLSMELLSKAQQQDRFSRIPLWVWLLVVVLLVIIVGIIVSLQEEDESAEKQADLETTPPTPKAARPAPATAQAVAEGAAPTSVVEAEATAVAVAEPAPPPVAEAPVATPPPRPDNLKRVKGIGPKIEKLLKENGITTFARLAKTEVSRLQALLDEAGWDNIADPNTWPEQAQQFAQTTGKG
jgi:predicted flap endonuclease-1-like 5' DNA nuclease